MKRLQALPNKISAIEKALQIAREEGETVLVGTVPEQVQLVCFDMDSTIIKWETINEIARVAGLLDKISPLTLRAMEGKDDFTASFLKRIKMLQGIPVITLEDIASRMPFADGLDILIPKLHKLGIHTAVITGNFNIFGNYLKKTLGFNHIYTTTPEVKNGTLTGTICGSIIDAPAKSSILIKICAENNIPLESTIAVGDGANDIPMLGTAAAAIAYNANSAKEGLDEAILPLL